MTRLAVLADIHGNLPALDAALRDLAGRAVDDVVVAGDVINWGPFSREVLEVAHGSRWPVVRGNNEYYLLDWDTPRAPADWTLDAFPVLPWLHAQLGRDWQRVIAAWPDTLSLRYPDAPPLRVVHGSPRSAWEAIYPDGPDDELDQVLAGVEERYVVAGHSHLPMDRRAGRWRIFNPGSVGLALDGTYDACYLLLDGDGDGWRPTFRRVASDRAAVLDAFERERFVERCGVVGQLIVEEFRTARIQLHAFVRWRQKRHPGRPVTWDLLNEFGDEERWAHMGAPYRAAVACAVPNLAAG
jgi:predicted phosphodiesterase